MYSARASSSVVSSSAKVRPAALEVAVDLVPDVVELGFDQLGRRLELVGRVERVEQLALDLLAGHPAVLALDLAAHDLAQPLQRFEAELLGRLVVDLELAGLRDLLDLDVEGRFLAGQMRGGVVLGERDGDGLLVAGLDADQLVLEAGDEFLRAEHQRLVAALRRRRRARRRSCRDSRS